MMSKNGSNSWGTLYGRPMERLAFRYDRHEEIVRYIRMWHVYYHPGCKNTCICIEMYGVARSSCTIGCQITRLEFLRVPGSNARV